MGVLFQADRTKPRMFILNKTSTKIFMREEQSYRDTCFAPPVPHPESSSMSSHSECSELIEDVNNSKTSNS